MRTTPSILAIPAFFTALAVQASAAVYNPTADFSVTNGNPNGVWSYGYSDDLDLADFSANFALLNHPESPYAFGLGWSISSQDPSISLNTTGTPEAAAAGIPLGALVLHPGPTRATLLRFTAPEAMTLDITGEFLAGDIGLIDLAVLINGAPAWTANNAGTFDLDATLLAGATVDFAVYGSYFNGSTPLIVTLTTASAIPEPSSFAALAGLATLALATTRRRRS